MFPLCNFGIVADELGNSQDLQEIQKALGMIGSVRSTVFTVLQAGGVAPGAPGQQAPAPPWGGLWPDRMLFLLELEFFGKIWFGSGSFRGYPMVYHGIPHLSHPLSQQCFFAVDFLCQRPQLGAAGEEAWHRS